MNTCNVKSDNTLLQNFGFFPPDEQDGDGHRFVRRTNIKAPAVKATGEVFFSPALFSCVLLQSFSSSRFKTLFHFAEQSFFCFPL